MKFCEKCGTKTSIIGQCIHPILGKKHIICRTCFLKLDKVIEQWRTFVFAHPDIINTLNIDGERLKTNFESNVISILRTYGPARTDEHSIEYQKNLSKHSMINENHQDSFPGSMLTSN